MHSHATGQVSASRICIHVCMDSWGVELEMFGSGGGPLPHRSAYDRYWPTSAPRTGARNRAPGGSRAAVMMAVVTAAASGKPALMRVPYWQAGGTTFHST